MINLTNNPQSEGSLDAVAVARIGLSTGKHNHSKWVFHSLSADSCGAVVIQVRIGEFLCNSHAPTVAKVHEEKGTNSAATAGRASFSYRAWQCQDSKTPRQETKLKKNFLETNYVQHTILKNGTRQHHQQQSTSLPKTTNAVRHNTQHVSATAACHRTCTTHTANRNETHRR